MAAPFTILRDVRRDVFIIELTPSAFEEALGAYRYAPINGKLATMMVVDFLGREAMLYAGYNAVMTLAMQQECLT